MCEVLDRIEARGREEGRAEGMATGKLNTLIDLVKDGSITLEKAAQKAEMTIEKFQNLLEQA